MKNHRTKLEYTFKSDILFRMLFINYQILLKRLVSVLLSINIDDITEFIVINADIPPEEIGKKFCRLDINMEVNGKKINLELQNRDEGNYPERTMYYWSRIYSSSLPSGSDYTKLPQTIIISIIDFNMFDCKEVHSQFKLMEINRYEPLSDKQIYHFFELQKLEDIETLDLTNEKNLWLALFNAETEEELEKLVSIGGEIMNQAVQAYHNITATEEFRTIEWTRRKTEHDAAQAMTNAINNAEKRRDEHWQSVVADKDAILADKEMKLKKQADLIAELEKKLGIKI